MMNTNSEIADIQARLTLDNWVCFIGPSRGVEKKLPGGIRRPCEIIDSDDASLVNEAWKDAMSE
jgi:hypothetical protein